MGFSAANREICLLTPGHLSTNPRLVKEADALADAGYNVKVICADYSGWAREADRSFACRRWKVVQALPFGPNAPTASRLIQLFRQRLARVAIDIGWRRQAVLRAAWHPITPDIVTAAKNIKADLYIAHYPAALPAAEIAAGKFGSHYAYDAEDFHLGDFPEGPSFDFQRELLRAMEKQYLSGCSYVTAASPGIADAYEREYGIQRPTVVLNVFPTSHAPAGPTMQGSAAPRPSIYWFSQTIGPDRGLECALRAIGQARSAPHLYLRGTPASGYLERLHNLATEYGVAQRLHILGPEAPSEMERLAACYDLGLIGETGHSPNRRIALTNKLFSYLLAGIPVIASDIPAHQEIAGECGRAVQLFGIDNSESLAAALDSLLESPERLASSREEAFRLGQTRFNWDIEKKIFLDRIEKSLAR